MPAISYPILSVIMKRFVLLAFILTQCAVSYKPIEPEKVEYEAVSENDDLRFAYRYDVLYYRHNPKLAKFEKTRGVRIVAAQITNKTNRTLNFARDMDLFTEEGEYPYTVDPATAAKKFSQQPAPYLLYGLLFYAKVDCEGVGLDCKLSKIIPFGLGIGVVNMIIASRANHAVKKEFEQYSIENRNIAPGETVYAILALEVEDTGYSPLQLELREVPGR